MHTARSSSRRLGGSGPDPPQFLPWMWAYIWSPSISPLGVGLYLIPLNFPLGCGPGSDPPQFPPWVWAWIWCPSISPLAVGLDLIPINFPPGCGPGWGSLGRGGVSLAWEVSPWQGRCFLGGGVSLAGEVFPWRGVSPWQGVSPWRGKGVSQHALRQTPPVNRMTDACENITLPQTSFAGGNKNAFQ